MKAEVLKLISRKDQGDNSAEAYFLNLDVNGFIFECLYVFAQKVYIRENYWSRNGGSENSVFPKMWNGLMFQTERQQGSVIERDMKKFTNEFQNNIKSFTFQQNCNNAIIQIFNFTVNFVWPFAEFQFLY